MVKNVVGKVLLSIEVVVFALVAYYSFSDGFTMTLDEAFGVSDKSGWKQHLLGSPDYRRVAISFLLIAIVFTYIYFRNRHNDGNQKH